MLKYDFTVFKGDEMVNHDLEYVSNTKQFKIDLLNYLMVNDLMLLLTGNGISYQSKLNRKSLPILLQ